MGIESPVVSAVIARMANPEINLAAYGGVVFPLSFIIEAPIIMLLPASVALCKDWASYLKVRRFMIISGLLLTLLHIFVAFGPLYHPVVSGLIGVPEEIVEPARLGLMIMTPWTWSIAYRRFQQGVMIRFGYSRGVVNGTIVRLLADAIMLWVGYTWGALPGVAMGAAAHAVGVMCEALYAGLAVRPILRNYVRSAPEVEPLSWRAFAAFYAPLAMTSFISLLWQPVGAAAISRMPMALESLAVWPVLGGVAFMLRSLGIAFNEVVVALIEVDQSYKPLKRFATLLIAALIVLHLLVVATPFGFWWFRSISALPEPLARMAVLGLWLALPQSPLAVLQSWFQGAILYGKKTRGIPESVSIFLIVILLVSGLGIWLQRVPGLYFAMGAYFTASLSQTLWLAYRSRVVLNAVRRRDEAV